jgi:phage-related protein
MGKIGGQGKATTRDFNQLTANFPALHPWEVLAELSGKTETELRDLAKQPGGLAGVVKPTELIDALIKKMGELPGAAGAMDRKMQTFGGTMEMFKDTMGVALAEGLQPFFTALQNLLKNPAIQQGLTKLATAFGELLGVLMDELAPVLPDLVDSFILMVKALAPAMPAIAQLAEVLALAFVQLAPLIEFLAKLVGVIGDLIMLIPPQYLGVIAAALIVFWLAFSGPIPGIIALIVGLVLVIKNNWGSIVQTFEEGVAAVKIVWDFLWDLLIKPLVEAVGTIVGWFQHLYDILVGNSIIPDLVNAIIGFFQMLWDTLVAIVQGIIDTVVAIWNTLWGFIETALGIIWTGITMYFNLYKTIITTIINAIALVISTVFNGIQTAVEIVWNAIKTTAQTVWDGIKLAITTPIDWLKNNLGKTIDTIKEAVLAPFRLMSQTVSTIWNGVKLAITTPIQAAYDFVKDIVDKIKGLVEGALDAVSSIPGAGVVGGAISAVGGLFSANGGIFTGAQHRIIGEAGPEAVIPLTNPMRAMQLMQQSGLANLAEQMGGGGWDRRGPLVTMPGAIIQDATDADLVAQRTLVAMQAAMIAA